MPVIKTIRLPRLPSNLAEQPQLLERYWDEAMTAIEKTLNAVLAIPEIQAGLAEIDGKVDVAQAAAVSAQAAAEAAQTAAETAQGSADGAQAQTEAQRKESSISQSYVTGYTGSIISATAAGLIAIAAHQRVYGDPTLDPSVAVNGATFSSGANPGDVVRVYYVDATRTGGAVTYQFTIDPANPPVQTGNTHSVGAVTIPVTGTKPGNGIRPPGYVEP